MAHKGVELVRRLIYTPIPGRSAGTRGRTFRVGHVPADAAAVGGVDAQAGVAALVYQGVLRISSPSITIGEPE